MTQTSNVVQSEQLVSESDYIELCRLVTEQVVRNDSGHADTIYELYSEDGELDIGTGTLRGHEAIREWGVNWSRHHLGVSFGTRPATCTLSTMAPTRQRAPHC